MISYSNETTRRSAQYTDPNGVKIDGSVDTQGNTVLSVSVSIFADDKQGSANIDSAGNINIYGLPSDKITEGAEALANFYAEARQDAASR